MGCLLHASHVTPLPRAADSIRLLLIRSCLLSNDAMQPYSAFSLFRQAFSSHDSWSRAWADSEPKKHYDVVIIGAGGHGLATAY
jgi:hypothetical protein